MAESMSIADLRSLLAENTFPILTEQVKMKIWKVTCGKTLHRVSGYDARSENAESRDAEEAEADRPLNIVLLPLKQNS